MLPAWNTNWFRSTAKRQWCCLYIVCGLFCVVRCSSKHLWEHGHKEGNPAPVVQWQSEGLWQLQPWQVQVRLSQRHRSVVHTSVVCSVVISLKLSTIDPLLLWKLLGSWHCWLCSHIRCPLGGLFWLQEKCVKILLSRPVQLLSSDHISYW